MTLSYRTHKNALAALVDEEPPYTCPLIDDVQAILRSVCEENMEGLRQANQNLRTWGHIWQDKAVNLSMENETLNDAKDAFEQTVKEQAELIKSQKELIAAFLARFSSDLTEAA